MQLVGLSALEYDEQYYAEHKDANLDYLGHGYWQEEYAKWYLKVYPKVLPYLMVDVPVAQYLMDSRS
jgi:hypothetical protein